jgi:hypothetical protein
MTLYETIYTRRQARKFNKSPLEQKILEDIQKCVLETEQFVGQNAKFEIVSAETISGSQSAPHYLLSFCDANSAAYANVG